jgi:acyl-CoA synthetase (NDP forming)
MADRVGVLSLSPLTDDTRHRLQEILAAHRIDTLVDVHNPLDVTPMAGDATFETIARTLLADETVDAAVIGCVPMTGALQTLPAGTAHKEDLQRSDSVVSRLARLRREVPKPWVAVVDAGELYDAMAAALESAAIPTFRTADRAVRMLSLFVRHRARGLKARVERGYATQTRAT